MLVRLLDRSIERIGEMAVGGRAFDRDEVARIAGAWEARAHGFFSVVALRPRLLREPRARGVLRAMATARSERDWMVRTAGAGIEPLIGRGRPEPRHYRDVLGRVRPGVLPVDGPALAVDYDLPMAALEWLSIERLGAGLGATLSLRAPRRYSDGDGHLHLTVDGLREVWFDSADTTGADVRDSPGGPEIRLGAEGLLRGSAAHILPMDVQWHLSRAGRAVDRITVRKRRAAPGDEPERWPGGRLWGAASAFREAVRRIHRVRRAEEVGRIPIAELCEVLAGAGTRAMAASDGPAADADRAFRILTERWSSVGPDGPEAGEELPDGARLTLMMYETESRLVTVNYVDPGDGRPRAAKMIWPERVLMGNDGDELTLTDGTEGTPSHF
ncbi:hypothetical protein Aph02nite_29520 [Actinoplanes philippinensis]|uniref:Uncharacterized protein n=2 Tax=Actinoplanes philippinensis TaxID=35752 RepID=A0A1I2EHW0_9ACTN|nr:hypothetical protein Aph02nite_29520 [Actinoplanes philippinensis]SFE92048.1 hypothetical protein SAMN05421541_104456 [Actinoplanes philippinensis]